MNKSIRTVSRQLITAVITLAIAGSSFAQESSRTYKETFVVGTDALLDINTSYTDIQFETWNKSQVEIIATVALEGATEEEIKDFFNARPIEIIGNSEKINVTSSSKTTLFSGMEAMRFNRDDLHIDISEVAPFVMEFSDVAKFPMVGPLPPLPPLPPNGVIDFDYEAYEKDGDTYLKIWQKEFDKNFDKAYEKKMEAWSKQMEERSKVLEKRMEEQEKIMVEREEKLVEIQEKRAKKMAEVYEKRAEKLEDRMAQREHRFYMVDSLHGSPNIFYHKSNGAPKNYKIIKSIRIKIPKSMRIKMNVRHGEVKLAANTQNLNATLSHSSLWASTIDGTDTNISASYTPVKVQRWNLGQLTTKYAEEVSLEEVLELRLQSTSSDIVINKLLKSAFIQADFGPLTITQLGSNFKELDVSVKNGELKLALPNVATSLYIKGNSSTLEVPDRLQLEQIKNGTTLISKSYTNTTDPCSSITISSEYSEVVLH